MLYFEVQINDVLRQRFIAIYPLDRVYSNIIQDLHLPSTKKNEIVLDVSKFGYPFRLVDGLLYSKDNEGRERLVILYSLIPEFLQDIYDDKHYFGKERMFYDFVSLYFRYKVHLVDQYMKHCYIYNMNRTDNRPPINSLQPIPTPLQSIHTITIDFITALPTISSKDIL